MKKQSKQKLSKPLHSQVQVDWRRWGATALLLCAFGGAPTVFAAPAATVSDDAALNFVSADIEAVIKAIGHYTNVTFIIDPRVKGTISLVSEKPLTKAQAFSLLTSTLRLQGFAVVLDDGFAKVVPEGDAKLQSGPTQTVAGGSKVKGDQIATQIFRLNYESSTNLVAVLRPLISPNNTINANAGNNTLVITDYADNLKRMGQIIAALDSPTASDMDIVPVRYAIASDIATLVNKLLEPTGPDSGRVILLPDSRTNSLILRAPSVARANLAKSLIAKLDQPTAQPGNVHVVYLRNSDAVKLAQTIRAVISSDSSAISASPAAAPVGAGQPAAAAPTLSSGGSAGFIQADPATNTLIISASEPVYRNLRAVIDQLDVRRAQVYIEALIVEVSADKAAEFGIQWLGATGNATSDYRLGGASAFSTGGNNLFNLATTVATAGSATDVGSGLTGLSSSTPATPGNGLTLGLFSQSYNRLGLGALAHALGSDNTNNILSTPNIITLDNEEAKIVVGQNVPFIGSSSTNSASAGASPFIVQNVDRKDVGLTLKVKPQISEGGTIKMTVSQEISSIADTTNAAGIITKKRSIDTTVLADDGHIIVLGGLIDDQTTDGVEKVPGLGDIPVLGYLFKNQKRSRTKTNLMIFLRPTVIRNNEQSVAVVADRYDYIRGVESNAQPLQSAILPEMHGAVLPPLENGQPVGGGLLKLSPSMKLGVQKTVAPDETVPAPAVTPAATK